LEPLKPANREYVLRRLGLVLPPHLVNEDTPPDLIPGVAPPQMLARLAPLKPENQEFVLRWLGLVRSPIHLAEGTDAPLRPVEGDDAGYTSTPNPTSMGFMGSDGWGLSDGTDPSWTGIIPPSAAGPASAPAAAVPGSRNAASPGGDGVAPASQAPGPTSATAVFSGATGSAPSAPLPATGFAFGTDADLDAGIASQDPETGQYSATRINRGTGKPNTVTATSAELERDYPKLKELTPEMREQGKRLILLQRARGWARARIDEAVRTPEEQAKKVAENKSEILNSRHLNTDGRGAKAMHLIHRKYGYEDDSPEAQQYLLDYGKAARYLGLRWGGDYSKKNPSRPYGWDPTHVEMRK
jgi:hypothetical protein